VLCGPILRRVTEDSVSVFVALSKPATVTLSIFNENAPDIPIGGGMAGSAPTVPLGQRLHVIVVTARFPDPLGPYALKAGQLYSYDLDFSNIDDQAAATSSLWSENLLKGEFALGYEADHLPGFALPPDLEHLHFVHGSCRKAGGENHDMLPLVDSLIARTRTDPHQRPHHLLLTGDQFGGT
jgi:hypothetical protein